MARLIPRKQIEEQQDISSSLNIRQDVNVGNNAIISGSLFVSKSFFLGTETGSLNEITGSVYLTGSLTIDGNLKVAAPETVLSITSSNTVLAVDTQKYAGILAKDFGANVPTLYVSSTDGDDNNDGRSIQYPLRTIKRAAALAAPGYDGRYGFDTGSIYNGYVIKVQAGTYLEDNPVILPKNTTIWGAGLRITKINAKNPEQDLFWVNSGCYIAEVTMGGLRLWPNEKEPERGFGVAFQPGAFITTSPYVQNCSQISNQENSFTELYEEIPPGGGGLYVNGDVIDPDSPLASMVLDAYTQISPNGVGCLVNGRGFIQLVSFFNNFSYYAIRVNNGGHATLNNSNISFGLYGMYASGSRFISGSGGNIDARDKVRAGWSVIVDVLNRGLDALPDVTTLNTDEGIKVTPFTQSYLVGTATASAERAAEVVADFNLVSTIVENGPYNFPTLLARSSNKGYGFDSPYNILGAEQITSSIATASLQDLANISSSFGVTLGIFADGTGSYNYTLNTENAVKTTNYNPVSMESNLPTTDFITGSVSASFNTIITILKDGLTAIPTLIGNNSASVYTNEVVESFSTGISASLSIRNSVSASLSITYNILANGTGSNILSIPTNHQRNFVVTNNNSSSYQFEGIGANPTITLFRGETYKFYVSASEAIGGIDYPFWIRTEPYEGISDFYDYNKGVINNGDSVGNITFAVPYDAPNTLYYTSQINNNLSGKFQIVNNAETPRDLIANTLTYPATILSSSVANDDINILNAYEILINNIPFIQEETIAFLSSSWSDFDYNQETCKRDISYIISGSAKDLLYGGNEESIRSGIYYYQYPSEATTTQLSPTLTAVKYASGLVDKLLSNITFKTPNTDREYSANCIINNREFIQNETIAYLSSSWSTFDYNEEKCKRDVGYILDAVATDLKYEGNERSIEAGRFYYLYPSQATGSQIVQTIDGIKYAAGLTKKLILNTSFQTASLSTIETYNLIRNNKSLIQDETIEFINVAYPTLEYNQSKCRRDVGYILDGVSTDILYGGNERSVASGRFYYDYPSIATSVQKTETSAGIRYSKIITEYIVLNTILDTPRIIYNDEKTIKVTAVENITSSFSGSINEKNLISSSFGIVEGIVKRGVSAINSIIAQNTNTNWSLTNPLKVSSTTQYTNSFVSPDEINKIGSNFDIVTSIIASGTGSLPPLTASVEGLIKVTDIEQISGTAATNNETSSISASFAHIINVIKGGTGSLEFFTSSVQNNIKATATSYSVLSGGISFHSASISSSMKVIADVLQNGLSSLPILVLNSTTGSLIKAGNVAQITTSSLDTNLSASLFVSRSIGIVVDILKTGNLDIAKTPYVTQSLVSDKQSLASSHIIANLDFIKEETIAYLSSSWSGFDYNEEKCRRDVGLIISGAAQDLYWGNISASVVNGQYYFEYPSQATGSQLQQTIDGIIYASNIAQKVIQGVEYQQLTGSLASSSLALKNNKGFIIDETIAYMSSSWGSFDYNEATCRRDLNYIIDSVRTDLVYGGNQRTRLSAEYYFLYPSDATGSQLTQTLDAVNYASRIAQKVVVGESFTAADTNKLNASNLLSLNKNLIANEVIAYVSSSWSNVYYNEDKCKRDVGYLIDAVRTDLVYGGNERSRVAGLFYYLYPSSATVAGVPSSTAQLDMTVTGMRYASELSQKIALNLTLQQPTAAVLAAANLVRADIPFIQQNVIDYTNDTFPYLNYNQSKCFRDVRFITDAVITDLVYGGNERTIEAGYFYYLYPSQATNDQLGETISAINFGRDLAKLVAIGGLEVERSFDIVAKIISSGSAGYPSTLIKNTESAIRATNVGQVLSQNTTSETDRLLVSSSFSTVIDIIANGTGSIPTIISSSYEGVARIAGSQITSSVNVSEVDKNILTGSFDTILNIIENGLSVIPAVVTNAISATKITELVSTLSTASISQSLINSTTSSFDIVLDIIENGTGSMVSLINNANSLVKVTGGTQYTTGIDASSKAGLVTSSFDTILDIIENGTSVIPTLVENTTSNIRIGSAPTSGTAATSTEADTIGSLIDIVTNIVENGTGSMATLVPYTSASTDVNVLNAYTNLKANITFIQNETIAYLSSSWSTASYDETKCKRDVGLIISGAAEDLLFNANSASLMNGKFYYLYPSQAETTQLNQTLDGINYAKRLAKKIVLNTTFVEPTAAATATKDLLINNKTLIADEVVAYISSSWTIGDNTSDPYFYNEATCKRDVGYILDAVATDIVYGGNERASKAGEFYYLYPSQATGYQLDQTLDGVRYAKNLAEQIVKGNTLISVSNEKIDARNIIDLNRTFISEEVVAYISSSWSEHDYNQSKCKRDVGYILDAVKTDLIYGGNERSRQAGEYYYKYPSNATGAELAPTLTGIKYAKGLVLEVLANTIFQTASLSKQTAHQLLKDNKDWIQTQTIANINAQLDTIDYSEDKCKRDAGYIIDAVATDILYGGNERSIEAGRYYFLYPSAATGSQLVQTLEGIGYTKQISENVLNNELVYVQITSSITPSTIDSNKINTLFEIVTDIISNGTGSIPTIVTNTTGSIKITDSIQYTTTASISQNNINNVNNAFDIVLDIVENGTGSIPSLIKNTNSLVKVTNASQTIASSVTSRSIINGITSSFDSIISIIQNGTSSLPAMVLNTESNIKRSNVSQYIGSGSATLTEANSISASIGIVVDIIKNGIASLPTIVEYVSQSSDINVWAAYDNLIQNIPFIQEETIAYLSSSWSSHSYDEAKCKRDLGFILSGSATDLLYGANSASIINGKYYYLEPSQATGYQLNETLDGIRYASNLAQKVILNSLYVTQSAEKLNAYNLIRNNREFIQSESIAYLSSSWSTHQYNETTCKRDISYIIDGVTTDLIYGGNERTLTSGIFYYLYPSAATGSQLDETITGINYSKNLVDRILRGGVFQNVSQNKLQAYELLYNNKQFIANEVIAYVSASWNGFVYNEETCKRDVGYIIDAVSTDLVYGGNERSSEAGRFYFLYPSEATTTQLGPTLSGIKHAKGLAENVLKNLTFVSASNSAQTVYNLLVNNKDLIQTETIGFLNSAWSFFEYNEAKCRRDVGYIIDAVATDILYGGNEASARAGEYYYLYPSLATVDGDGDAAGQLGQTLDGINFAKGLANKVGANEILKSPTTSQIAGWNLLVKNKTLIQSETIAFLSSSWTGVDGFTYNQASCSRDVAYIVDNVATDLVYGGNERSSKAGEYYYLYPSKAIEGGIPSSNTQLEQTIDGVAFAAGVAQNVVSNIKLEYPTTFVSSSVELMRANRTFIQNETIQAIDAFYPYLVYNREKCRRDVGYIVDNVSTDLWYGGNERALTAGYYYFLYPSLATGNSQVIETVAGVNYAKNVARKVVLNTLLSSPLLQTNTDNNIKVGSVSQYTSGIIPNQSEITSISASFAIVTNIISGGVEVKPETITNASSAIKVTNEAQIQSHISASSIETGITTASFGLIRDIIYNGSASLPDSLANNFNYGFENSIPSLLHISSLQQTTNGSASFTQYTSSLSSSFANVISIVNNGTASIPTIVENTSASIKAQTIVSQILPSTNGETFEKNRINSLYNVVLDIIESEAYPILVSNTSASVKVTNTPQFLSGSGADRIQAKIVSSSFGIVSNILFNGTGSVTYQAPNVTPNTNVKTNLAYNLLTNNKQMIVDETIAFMSSSWSTFVYNEASCSRDLGFIIDGAAYDLLYGGNSASIVNGKYYYDYPSAATGSQLDQTITAIRFASGLAEKVVRNITLEHISSSLSISSSYSTLRQNKEFIKTETIAYLSSSWSEFDYNETTCKRDIGYIIDAVSTDLLYGGNERSYVAGKYYYDFPSQATDSQLQPTLDGVQYAKGLSVNIISGSILQNASNDVLSVYNLIKDNKKFIQEETLAFVNAKYPYLYYNEDKCKRDVGFILDAVMTDLKWGGNQRSSKAGEFYYLYPSLATESEQVVETTTAIDYARRMIEQIIVGNVIAEPQVILNTANSIKVTNIPQYVSASSATTYEVNRVSSSFSIVTNTVENGLVVLPTIVSNVSESIFVTTTPQIGGIAATQTESDYISSSISIVTDIIQNGTGSFPVLTSYGAASTDPNVINAYNNLIQNIPFIQSETIAYISSSWSFFNYNEASCSRDVAYIVSGAAEDLLYNSTSASYMNGYYYFLFPSNATVIGDGDGIGQLGQTLDGINYASKLAQQIVLGTTFVSPSTERKVASELLKLNKEFIAAETIAYISSSWVTGSNSDLGFVYNQASCSRDVKYILDNVATDVLYGGNERTIKAASYYFLYPSQATGSQLDETLDGIRYAGQLAEKVIVNTQFVTASIHASASYALMKANKPFIQAETIAYVSSSWVGFDYNEAKCRRDVGYLVDAVSTDILYGGNERSAKAGIYYYKYPSSATGSQLEPTVNAIDFAGGVAENIIKNTTFITASQSVSASVELLRNNRNFIQEETMQYLTASWSTFDYNKEKCRRDVGYILDGVVTDLLYGGNERTVMSGEFYFKYPSKATLLGDGDGEGQLKQTTDGINYASRIAQKVAQNIVFQTASIEVSASFDLLRKNKPFIAAETIAYVSSSWSTVVYNEASCSRDVGYIIDAAATDLLYGGTERSITAGKYYYLFPSRATNAGVPSETNQLDPTITGIRYAGKLAAKSVLNPIYTASNQDNLNARTLLQKNKLFIQKETIAFLSSSWSTLKYNEVSCSRDLGFILDAVVTDLVYGGNERSIEAGSYYYKIPSVAIKPSYTDNGDVGQLKQTVDGINYAKGVSEKIVLQTQLVFPQTKRREAYQRLLAAKDELKQRAIGYTNGAFPYLVYNEASCSRDTGLIVDAVATDLLYGGNERSIAAASSYYTGQYKSAAVVVNEQKLETLETNRYLRTRAEFIAAGAPVESFGSLIVATGIDYSYNGAGVTFKALPPNQGGSGVANPIYEITELAGGRIYFTSGNQDGDFRIGTGLSINQATGTLVGRTFSKSLFSLVTPFSLALEA